VAIMQINFGNVVTPVTLEAAGLLAPAPPPQETKTPRRAAARATLSPSPVPPGSDRRRRGNQVWPNYAYCLQRSPHSSRCHKTASASLAFGMCCAPGLPGDFRLPATPDRSHSCPNAKILSSSGRMASFLGRWRIGPNHERGGRSIEAAIHCRL
jgi:hypothetical protein